MNKKFPRHVAIIMDGNGRWAKNKGKKKFLGHQAGIKAANRAIKFAIKNNLNVLTLYAFSSENWNRPIREVTDLMKLFISVINYSIKILNKNNIRLKIIGDLKKFDTKLQKKILQVEKLTRKNNGLFLNIAANYGGRWDILNCFKKILNLIQSGVLKPNQIDENILKKYLCLNEFSPVDLVIRTGGEYRISNFLLWQIAYSEFYFTDILWPDFNKIIFKKAINSFLKRKRSFGR